MCTERNFISTRKMLFYVYFCRARRRKMPFPVEINRPRITIHGVDSRIINFMSISTGVVFVMKIEMKVVGISKIILIFEIFWITPRINNVFPRDIGLYLNTTNIMSWRHVVKKTFRVQEKYSFAGIFLEPVDRRCYSPLKSTDHAFQTTA